MHPTITSLVEEVRDLPMSMSETLPAVIEACDNADTSVNDLTGLISADQSLVAMLLKLANSAYYGYARRIETLPEAIVLLGFSTIKSLAITATTMNLLFQNARRAQRYPSRNLVSLTGCRCCRSCACTKTRKHSS